MHKNNGADAPWNFQTSEARMSYDIDLIEGEEIQIEAAYKQGPRGPAHRKFLKIETRMNRKCVSTRLSKYPYNT